MSGSDASRYPVLAVVLAPAGARPGAPLVVEVCGVGDQAHAAALAARLAERHHRRPVVLGRDPVGRRVLRLGPAALSDEVLSDEVLADLLAPLDGVEALLAVTGRQRDLLLAAVSGPQDRGCHVEQVSWTWSGPLDRARFTAAWQSVAEREPVLRARFDLTAAPRLVLDRDGAVEVAYPVQRAAQWEDLLREERRRGFQVYRPGLLRVAVLAQPGGARILVSYHQALLDERGTLLLVREFYRAYLADGRLPGGRRRPDLQDHARWLARQDTSAARQFWRATAPPADTWTGAGRPGPPTGHTGRARVQRRLRAAQAARLRSWAALRGAGESSALHVVWALLLYRAAGRGGAVPVGFGVQLSGRDLPLRGAAGVPGLLGNVLPLTVTVDPAAALVDLLRQARDAALDLAWYAWVPGELVRSWQAPDRGPDQGPDQGPDRGPDLDQGLDRGLDCGAGQGATVVRFDAGTELPADLRAQLAGQGVRLDAPRGGGTAAGPLTLAAGPDGEGGLLLSIGYDRAHLTDQDAAAVLSQCLRLLRGLPDQHDLRVPVGQVLRLLDGAPTPHTAPTPGTSPTPDTAAAAGTAPTPDTAPTPSTSPTPDTAAAACTSPTAGAAPIPDTAAACAAPAAGVASAAGAAVVLRAGRQGADLVCLVEVPGVPAGTYEALARADRGGEWLVRLRLEGGAGQGLPAALLALLAPGRRLVLVGCGPAAGTARVLARGLERRGSPAAAVVLAGLGEAGPCALALERGLEALRVRALPVVPGDPG